jgi:hypothetical protein
MRAPHQLGPLEANMPGPLNDVTASSAVERLLGLRRVGHDVLL